MDALERIIDFEKKGNVVRFYIGTDKDYWGDDWNDAPYEHNAGSVYYKYVTRIIDVAFPFNAIVCEPGDDTSAWGGNSPFTKENMKKRDVPCLIVVPPDVAKGEWDTTCFAKYAGSARVVRFFFDDSPDVILNCQYATIMNDKREEEAKGEFLIY